MKADDESEVVELLEAGSVASRLQVADRLKRLAMWHAVNGALALLDSTGGGWPEIHRSWLYRSLGLRIIISEFQKGRVLGPSCPVKSLGNEATPTALCLMYAIIFRRELELRVFGDSLRAMIMDNEVVREEFWQSHPLEPFTVQLLALWKGEVLDVGRDLGRSLGPYEAVFKAWAKPAADIHGAIQAACNFHCERIEDAPNGFRPEFSNPPFDLLPAEILAIYYVRQTLGLETPVVDHPLLALPFGLPIGTPSDVYDEFLDRTESATLP